MSFSAFKSVRLYRLSAPITSDAESFSNALAQFRFEPCMAQDVKKSGFYQPLHVSMSTLAHKSGDLIVFAVKTQEKILPPQSIADELAPRVSAKEQELARPLTRAEKQALKEAVTLEMLPRCLTRSSVVHGYYDTARNLIAIGAASSAKCEDVLALLRKALGSLPALPFFDAHKLSSKLQLWGQNKDLPGSFIQGSKMYFESPGKDGGKARFDGHLLTSNDVQAHFEDKLAVLLELELADEMTLTIKDDGALSGIKYNDKLIGQNDEMGWEDTLARLDADMLLLSVSLGKVIDVLATAVPWTPPAQTETGTDGREAADALLEQVKAFVIESRQASISGVQRQFRIGYNRAARLVEHLEFLNVVSGPSTDGGRQVLV